MSYSQLEIFNIMKRHKEDLRASIPADQRNPDIDRYNDQADDILMQGFKLDKIHQGMPLKGVVSRKIQIVPNIMEILDR